MPTYRFETSSDLVLKHTDTEKPVFESTDDKYDLSFACLLIPRFETHLLVGDVVESLHEWMQTICISYGWKLKLLNIQPAYMQWVTSVAVTVAPAQIVRITRMQTSRTIFEDYPRFRRLNLGNDFWAPSHLVIVGNQLHSEKIVREYITLTRQQQMGTAAIPVRPA
jgi:REP element-mobilizing transposase RayT